MQQMVWYSLVISKQKGDTVSSLVYRLLLMFLLISYWRSYYNFLRCWHLWLLMIFIRRNIWFRKGRSTVDMVMKTTKAIIIIISSLRLERLQWTSSMLEYLVPGKYATPTPVNDINDGSRKKVITLKDWS